MMATPSQPNVLAEIERGAQFPLGTRPAMEVDGRNVMNVETKRAKAERLRELHRRESILVLPNAWDPLSVRAFESCGFRAVVTPSAGIAYSFGYPDGERLGREEMAEATTRIVVPAP